MVLLSVRPARRADMLQPLPTQPVHHANMEDTVKRILCLQLLAHCAQLGLLLRTLAPGIARLVRWAHTARCLGFLAPYARMVQLHQRLVTLLVMLVRQVQVPRVVLFNAVLPTTLTAGLFRQQDP